MHPSRRRDRHGRGLRGLLAPVELPLRRTRAEHFDGLVLDAVDALESRWRSQLREIEFAVEEVPPAPPLLEVGSEEVPLGRASPASGSPTTAARIVVYRRPVEARASPGRELAELVHAVVVEQLADLMGVEPRAVDPDYGSDEEL